MSQDNPYAAPTHGADAATADQAAAATQGWEYLGFWPRVVASFLDNIILFIIGLPIGFFTAYAFSGSQTAGAVINQILSILASAAFIFGFWIARNATPGKMIYKAQIRRFGSFAKPTIGQYIGRYFAYILSALPLGAGFIWCAFEKNKRCWHDMLAGTVVVRPARDGAGVRPGTGRVGVRRGPAKPASAAKPAAPVRPGARPAADLAPARSEG